MNDESQAELSIVTSMLKAIELHGLTHMNFHSGGNQFLYGMEIQFQKPEKHQATLSFKGDVPNKEWFCLFDDAEKGIMEDEYIFYGISYRTIVKLARKRVGRVIEIIEDSISTKGASQTGGSVIVGRRNIFYQHDRIQEMEKALKHFDDNNEITMTFLFSEWPNAEQAKKSDYVKEFKTKITGYKTQDEDDFPF